MPKPTALIVTILLTMLVGMGAISTDIYLPSLPSITEELSTNIASVQLTLSIFMIAFAISQLAYGPISDRFGRRPALLGGMALYLVASLGCAFSTSIELLIVARFFQALGACSGPSIARAVVRDIYGTRSSARILAYMGTAMALAPILGPILGGYLEVWLGWQANFAIMAMLGGISLVGVLFLLSETNSNKDKSATNTLRMVQNYTELATNRHYMGYVLASAFAFCGLFSFISASSFIFINFLNLTPDFYGMCFAAIASGYMAGTFCAGRLTTRLGINPLVRLGTTIIMLAGTGMVLLNFSNYINVASLLIPMVIYMFGFGLLHPNAIAGAIGPQATRAGAASALFGFTQLGMAALVGAAIGQILDNDPTPMVMGIFLSGVACYLAYSLLAKPKLNQRG